MEKYMQITKKYGMSVCKEYSYLSESQIRIKIQIQIQGAKNKKKHLQDEKEMIADFLLTKIFRLWANPLKIQDLKTVDEKFLEKENTKRISKELFEHINFGYVLDKNGLETTITYDSGLQIRDIEEEYPKQSEKIIKQILDTMEDSLKVKYLFDVGGNEKIFEQQLNEILLEFFSDFKNSALVRGVTQELREYLLEIINEEIELVDL